MHPKAGPSVTGSFSADQLSPVGNIPAGQVRTSTQTTYTAPSNANGNLGGNGPTLSVTGGSQPLPILQPYGVINFIIALQGIYPVRP